MLLDVLGGFIQELRAAGVPVSMVEAIDATQALRHTDLSNRSAFKSALGATMVKNVRHLDAFDTAFEVFFAHHRPEQASNGEQSAFEPPKQPGGKGDPAAGAGGGDLDELLEAPLSGTSFRGPCRVERSGPTGSRPVCRNRARQARRRNVLHVPHDAQTWG